MPRKDPEARRAYHREYMRKWYAENKEKHAAYVARVSKRVYEEISEYVNHAKKSPCTDCGGTFPPEAMDFDHLRDKKFSIGKNGRRSLREVVEEITKCELVCSNCHRVRTKARRRGIA